MQPLFMVLVAWCAIFSSMPSVSTSRTLDTLTLEGSSCDRAPAGDDGVVCSLSGDMQLISGSAVSGNISITGLNDTAVLHLAPSDPLVLRPGSALYLSHLTLSNASFAGAPDPLAPLAAAYIQLSGITVQPGVTLALSNLSIQLDCAAWAMLFDVFCLQGYANGIVKV